MFFSYCYRLDILLYGYQAQLFVFDHVGWMFLFGRCGVRNLDSTHHKKNLTFAHLSFNWDQTIKLKKGDFNFFPKKKERF